MRKEFSGKKFLSLTPSSKPNWARHFEPIFKRKPILGRRIGFLGQLSSMSRAQARSLVEQHGGFVIPTRKFLSKPHQIDWLVLGEGDYPLGPCSLDGKALPPALRGALAHHQLRVLAESDFWMELGLMDQDSQALRLVTPALLADLVGVEAWLIRRWYRMGWIRSKHTVYGLPYFAGEDLLVARELARLVQQGLLPSRLEWQLSFWARRIPNLLRELGKYRFEIHEGHLLLQTELGLMDHRGQLWWNWFDQPSAAEARGRSKPATVSNGKEAFAEEESSSVGSRVIPANEASAPMETLSDGSSLHTRLARGEQGTENCARAAAQNGTTLSGCEATISTELENWHEIRADVGPTCAREFGSLSAREYRRMAETAEEQGNWELAAEAYRAALAAEGPNAEICFQLAEALYRAGDLSAARERYFAVLELDETFLEARINLGCLLAEMGDRALAIAALEGALELHPRCPDAHYHLAEILEELGQPEKARQHWRMFLTSAAESPWAQIARERLARLSGEKYPNA